MFGICICVEVLTIIFSSAESKEGTPHLLDTMHKKEHWEVNGAQVLSVIQLGDLIVFYIQVDGYISFQSIDSDENNIG